MNPHDSMVEVMGHSYINHNVHIIFHTKANACTVEEEHLSRTFHYISGAIRAMSGHAFIVGGRPDHVHILSTLPATISLADFVRNIKSNTSKWLKGIDERYEKFSWQEGYGAFSVSESSRENVINYIKNQKAHHKNVSAPEEFKLFLIKHGIEIANTQ